MIGYDCKPGEIWQEADNCAILCLGHGKWLGYGSDPFGLDDPLVALPLRRLLTADGEIAPERLVAK